ncbi:MAG TPA: alternative ribosome rescue aminoacyl-tRNA hydrolase ArfB [Pseudonocardiaceae bacterium]|jgi:ribosome-associated protein|nr:alternative ribosome rescue aminoacyl-tRNA hydrolase ArfB [Pseudonocardiaceae bacterium]
MAEDLEVTATIRIPADELRERFSRSSGPGGQGVNTADSRVELSFDLTGSRALSEAQRSRAAERLRGRLVGGVLTVVASEHRNQLANRRAARLRLAAILRAALRPPTPPRRTTKPSRGSVERRLSAKRRRSDTKRNRSRPTD